MLGNERVDLTKGTWRTFSFAEKSVILICIAYERDPGEDGKKFDELTKRVDERKSDEELGAGRGGGALSPFRAHREPVRKLQFLQHLVMTPPPFPKPTPNNKCTFSLTTTISESYLSLFPGHWWWSPQALPELPQAREAGDEPKFDHCRFQSRKCRTVRQDRKTAMRILRSIILPIGFVHYTVKPQRSDILPLCFEEVHSRLCRYQLRQSVTKETEEK